MAINTKKIQRESEITINSKRNKDDALSAHKEDVKKRQSEIEALEAEYKKIKEENAKLEIAAFKQA